MSRVLLVAALLAPVIASAAPPTARDPDWPCQQIKVPELSIASIWSGPAADPRQIAWKDDPEVADLVQKLAPRREPIDQAQNLIHDFAQHTGDRKQAELLQLLAGLFTILDEERDSVMTGLDRFGRRQKELAEQVRADNEELRALQADPAQDARAIEQMTQKVTWEAEVFQDRRQALSYACEVPGKIEQRLFSLARQIQHELE
jgi:predicted  nucleic acid-binding Zn-ribbon protein